MGMKAAGAKLFLEGGLLNRALYAGWMSNANSEIAPSGGQGYTRVQIPAYQNPTTGGWRQSALGHYVNRNQFRFGTPTANWGSVTHLGLWDAMTAGNLLISIDLNTDLTVNSGNVSGADANQIGIQRNSGAVTAAGFDQGLIAGLFDGTRYLAMHTGSPTTGNQIGNYVGVAEASVSPVSNRDDQITNPADINFGTYAANLARPTHIGLWTANNGGTLLASTTASADDPEAGAKITLQANRLIIAVTVD